jgi:hypothetical protein
MSGECDECGEHCLDCRCCQPLNLHFFDHLKNVNHPWSQFLYARAVAMNWMREEMNRSNAEIAMALSMDEMQVRLILMQWDESVTPPSGTVTKLPNINH